MNKKKQKKETAKTLNTVRCTIPGLMSEMDLVFPHLKLPVCKKCKSVFKSRRLCRERDGHTAFPWNDTFICFILDDSCFAADEMGNECLVREDGPNPHDFFTEIVEFSDTTKYEYVVKYDSGDKLDPICAPCKLKGCTTRTDCREFYEHKYLPWNTIYMKLHAKQSQRRIEVGSKRKKNALCFPTASGYTHDHLVQPTKKMKIGIEVGIHASLSTNDTNATHSSHLFSRNRNKSKAFLLTLSDNKCQFEWLRMKNVTPPPLKGLEKEEDARNRLQKNIESHVPSKLADDPRPSEEATGPAEKKTMTKEQEKLTIDEIYHSQLPRIYAIAQGQNLRFDQNQEEREEDQQQQPCITNENAKSYPRDHNKLPHYPVLAMIENDRSHYSPRIHQDLHQLPVHQYHPNPHNTMYREILSTGMMQDHPMLIHNGSENNPYLEEFHSQRGEDRYSTSNSMINNNNCNIGYKSIHNSIHNIYNQHLGIPDPLNVSLLFSQTPLHSRQQELQLRQLQQQLEQQLQQLQQLEQQLDLLQQIQQQEQQLQQQQRQQQQYAENHNTW